MLKKEARRFMAAILALAAFSILRPSPAVSVGGIQPAEETPKLVALTFDDGPKRSTTGRLLTGLSQRGTQATFFLIGAQLEGNEDLVRQMEEEGHQVGIHTYDHVALTELNEADFRGQVDKTRALLTGILGHGDFLLRPPYGSIDAGVRRWADAPLILWSVDPEDWRDRNTQRVVAHIVSHVQDGDIILMHDIFPESVDAALQVVDQLHAAGYAFVTVDTLLAARGIEAENGVSYRCARPD